MLYNINVIMMKKYYIFIILFLFFIILITVIGAFLISGDISIKEEKDILVIQKNKEVYFDVYGYDLDNPNIIVNPYGNSPLTALIMFTSADYSEVEVEIKGKNDSVDINYKFGKNKYHMLPIYGLYPDYDNVVILRCEGNEKVIKIKTDKLPDDFINDENVIYDNFMFYNINYPYIIDSFGDVRWYLNSNYYGNITSLDNSSFIIGSDRYNEQGNVISFYKMNFLGKIYNEYIIDNYYGFNSMYNDNIMVLGDKILLIDIQTGEIVDQFGSNDGYNYLDFYDGNIIVRKDDVYYSLNNSKLEEISYNSNVTKVNFYNNTNNYKIMSPNRFGTLKETIVSDEKILLFGYDKLTKIENIDIIREVDRIKVINSNDTDIYVIFDKFMDKRIYNVKKLKYINLYGLNGKYTIYIKVNDKLYKTDYYIEV